MFPYALNARMFPKHYHRRSERVVSSNRVSQGRERPSNGQHSSQSTSSHQQSGSRRHLGVYPGRGEFTTAVVIVFALGGFLFVCGLIMLFGGLGGHSRLLVGIGVASVVGGILLTIMGWTLCLKITRKSHRQEGSVVYRSAVLLPVGQMPTNDPPPSYIPLPGSPGPPYSESSIDVSSPSGVGGRQECPIHVNPYLPPPSYDEALQSPSV